MTYDERIHQLLSGGVNDPVWPAVTPYVDDEDRASEEIFMNDIIRECRQNNPVVFFSYRTTRERVVIAMLCQMLSDYRHRVTPKELLNMRIGEGDLVTYISELSQFPLTIDTTDYPTTEELTAAIREQVEQNGVDTFFVEFRQSFITDRLFEQVEAFEALVKEYEQKLDENGEPIWLSINYII